METGRIGRALLVQDVPWRTTAMVSNTLRLRPHHQQAMDRVINPMPRLKEQPTILHWGDSAMVSSVRTSRLVYRELDSGWRDISFERGHFLMNSRVRGGSFASRTISVGHPGPDRFVGLSGIERRLSAHRPGLSGIGEQKGRKRELHCGGDGGQGAVSKLDSQ